MDNKKKKYYDSLFIVSAFYDWILGAAFLLFYKPVFDLLAIEIPANTSYMSLAAAFVFVSGFLYYFAYKNFQASRDLIKMGIIYKFFYVAVGIYYLSIGQLPHPIFLVFGIMDATFIVFYFEFLNYTKKG